MQLSFAAPHAIDSGALIVGALEGGTLSAAAQKADKAAGGALTRGLKVSSFTGKSGQVLEILAPASVKASRILLKPIGRVWYFQLRGCNPVMIGGRKRRFPELRHLSARRQIAQSA